MSTLVYPQKSLVPQDFYLCGCAVSGGTLEDYLRRAMAETGGRLCPILHPVYMDFPLPCPDGIGNPLTVQMLKNRYNGAPCYFSRSLCTEYFTYVKDGQAHVTLYDSLRSLREKAALLKRLGIPAVVVEDPKLRKELFP